MSKYQCLPMQPEHYDQVWQIEQQAHAYPWSESMIRQQPAKFAFNCVLVEEDIVVGYFYAQCIAGEVTLLNVAVAPSYQGQGLGRQLMVHFNSQSLARGGEEAWLEVRESNIAAYGLYESLGFNEIDRRRNYYPSRSGREDALVMTCYLD